jgi:hypothetical protein
VNFSFFPRLAASRTRSSACDTLSRSCARRVRCWSAFPLGLCPPPSQGQALAPPAPRRNVPLCSPASLLLRQRQTSRVRASPVTAPRLSDAGQRRPTAGQTRDLPVPVQEASARARVYDHAPRLRRGRLVGRALAMARPSMLPSGIMTPSAPGTFLLSRLNGWPVRSTADASPTPSRGRRTARGRCGSLLLHRSGLAPPTPCRF